MSNYYPQTRLKLPADVLTYTFDFTSWGFLEGDPIVSAVMSAAPSGLTLSLPAINSLGTKVQCTISGGVAGTTYTVSCVASTNNARTVQGDGYLELVSAP